MIKTSKEDIENIKKVGLTNHILNGIKEPSCLNEIPMVAIITYEHGYDTDVDEDKESGLIKLSDVQRLVCRRIIKNYERIEKLKKEIGGDVTKSSLLLVVANLLQNIEDDKRDFNITDTMIEEERKRIKEEEKNGRKSDMR